MTTFLELLQNKALEPEALRKMANVWRLGSAEVGLAIITSEVPSIEQLEKLSTLREQCHRVVALLPESARESSLLWLHSSLIDNAAFYSEDAEGLAQQIDPVATLKL